MSGKDHTYKQGSPTRARSQSPRCHDAYSSLGNVAAARPERSQKMKDIQTREQREKMIFRGKHVANIVAQREQDIINIRARDLPYRFENDRLKKELSEKNQEIKQLKCRCKAGKGPVQAFTYQEDDRSRERVKPKVIRHNRSSSTGRCAERSIHDIDRDKWQNYEQLKDELNEQREINLKRQRRLEDYENLRAQFEKQTEINLNLQKKCSALQRESLTNDTLMVDKRRETERGSITKLQQKLQRALETNNSLQTEASDMRYDMQKKDDVIRQHKQTIERLTSEYNDLSSRRNAEWRAAENKFKLQEDEISGLRKIASYEERGPASLPSTTYHVKYRHTGVDILAEGREHNMTDYHKEKTRQKTENTQLQRRIGELEAELQKTVSDSDSFRKEAQRIFRKQTSDFEKKTSEYQECIYNLKAKLKSIEDVVQTEDTDISQGQPSVFSRAQNLNNDNSRMQREQACVESDNTEDNKVLRHERESLRARNTELFDENKKLQKTSIDYEILLTQHHKVSEENRELRQQLKDIESINRSDKSNVSEMKRHLNDEIVSLQNENKQIEHVNDTLSLQIQQIEESKEQMKEQVSCLEGTIDDLEEKLEQIQSHQATNESLKIKRYQEQFRNLQSEKQRQQESLKLQMEEMRRNRIQEQYDLNQNNTALQVDKQKLVHERAADMEEKHRKHVKEMTTIHEEKCRNMQLEHTRITEETEWNSQNAIKKMTTENEQKCREMQNRMAAQEKQIKLLERNVADQKRDISALNGEIGPLRGENYNMQDKTAAQDKKIREHKRKVADQQKENAKIKEDLERSNVSQREKITKLEEKIEQLTRQITDQKGEIAGITTTKCQLEEENQHLRLPENKQKEIKDMERNNASLQEKIKKLGEQNERLTKQLADQKGEISAMNTKSDQLREENHNLRKESNTLKRGIDRLNGKIDTQQFEWSRKLTTMETRITALKQDLERTNTNIAGGENTVRREKDILQKNFRREKDALENTVRREKDILQKNFRREKDALIKEHNERQRRAEERAAEMEEKYRKLVNDSGKHLASQMGRDETKVENISRKARPSTIREAYGQLSFQTGSNIKQNMQKPYGVDDKTWKDFKNDFICVLFMESWEYMEDLRQKNLAQLASWMKQPLASTLPNTTTDKSTLSSEAQATILNLFREHSSEIDVKAHCKKVKSSVLNKAIDNGTSRLSQQAAGHCVKNNEIDNFVESVCKLSWQMVCQQPPMTFTTEGIGQPADEDTQKVIPGRDLDFSRMDRLVVERYIEPTLQHGIHIMEKGRVIMCARPSGGSSRNNQIK